MITEALDRLVEDRPASAPARRWLAEHHWPGPRDEAWRYAPLAAIAAAAERPEPGAGEPAGALAPLLAGLPAGPRIVLVGGRYHPGLSELPTGDGLVVKLGAAAGRFEPGAATDAFAVANHLAAIGTTRIRVTGAARRPVHLVHLAVDARPSHPRTEVLVGPGAHLELIETFRAAPGGHLTNAATMIEVGAGGHLDHLRILEGAPGHAHVGRTEITAAAGATVRSAALASGPGAARQTVAATITGDGAAVTLGGLSAPAGGAHCDTTVSVHHRASGATSRQGYAGVVADGGRASFTGQVTVAAGTRGTDADQQNRNLLLGPNARADARPWLQIDADDVACTHGAAVGRLDDAGLFYLRSRGIPEREARAMLVTAFARTALDDILPPGPAHDWLAASTATAISAVLDGPEATS